MQINSIKTQSFGANPSRTIRVGLARAQANGANITELLGLIKEVHPNKYMTMLEENGKVHAVGLTDVIDITATKKLSENPQYSKKRQTLYEKIIEAYHPAPVRRININQHADHSAPFVHTDKKQSGGLMARWAEFTKKEQELRAKYPQIDIIEEPSFEEYGYIPLFKSEKGEIFDKIITPLTNALKKIQKQQTQEQRALDKIDSMFPAYERLATLDELAEETKRASRTYVPEPRIGDYRNRFIGS